MKRKSACATEALCVIGISVGLVHQSMATAADPQSPPLLHPQQIVTRNDLEFVEVWNHSAQRLDIGNWRLNRAIDFTFPPLTNVPANSGVVVVSFDPATDTDKAAAFRRVTGVGVDVVLLGPYSGVLDNGGENFELDRPVNPNDANTGHVLVDRVDYDDDPAWPTTPVGQGSSLQRVLPTDYGNFPASCVAGTPSPGTAEFIAIDSDVNGDGRTDSLYIDMVCSAVHDGEAEFDFNQDGQVNLTDFEFFVGKVLRTHPGDANVNGIFNSGDLVAVFVAGEYEDQVDANSTWAEGDWNCDREFDTRDLVAAFQAGAYVQAAVAKSVASDADVGAAIEDVDRRLWEPPM